MADVNMETNEVKDTTLVSLIFDKKNKLITKERFLIFFYCFFAIGLSVFQLYTAYFGIFESWRQRSVHLIFILFMAFLNPRIKHEGEGKKKYYMRWDDVLLLLVTIFVAAYMLFGYQGIILRDTQPNLSDKIVTFMLVVLTMLAAYRYVGWPLVLVAAGFIAYLYTGPYLPRFISHPDFSSDMVVSILFNTTSGIIGLPLGVSTMFIVNFIIFGAFLIYAGVGEYFIELADAMVGWMRGGPAKTAIIASALMGTVNGTGPGNVATTGTFTIPLMKKNGYKPYFAGAVEAAASTGGILLPPVMGAAAFLIAEFCGISYFKVTLHGLFPALLYFIGVYAGLEIRTRREEMLPLYTFDMATAKSTLKRVYMLMPLPFLIIALAEGMSPMKASFYGTVAIFVLSLFNKKQRMGVTDVLKALERGASNSLIVAISCSVGGIIIGLTNLTGLGLKIARIINITADPLFALIITMITCVIIGMGLPVTAAYIIVASLTVPALVAMKVPLLVAHFFIFYYATMAAITPPVGMSFYTAASIAESSYMRTGFASWNLALAGFIVPFMFFYNNALLYMQSFADGVFTFLTAAVGVIILAIGTQGWLFARLSLPERIICIISSLCLIKVGWVSDMIGLGIFAGVALYRFRMKESVRTVSPL